MHTGLDFNWSDECACPRQLAFQDATKSYITGRQLDEAFVLAPLSVGNGGMAWSGDGQVLYTVDAFTRLIRMEFASKLRPSSNREITPQEWDGRVEKLVGIWLSPNESQIYCLTLLRTSRETALWCVSADGNEARRILSGERLYLTDDVQRTERELVVTGRTEEPGTVVCTNVSTGVRTEFQVSTEHIGMPTMSPCGKYCVYLTTSETGDHELNLYDVATRHSEFLIHASYASWSPDSRYLAAVLADVELVLIDRESEFASTVLSRNDSGTRLARHISPSPPLWSSDGRWIVFRLSQPRKLSHPQLMRWIAAGQTVYGSEAESDEWCNVDPRTFVLNVKDKSIIPLPIASDRWAWRPKPVT